MIDTLRNENQSASLSITELQKELNEARAVGIFKILM
jgi:hypothetical protein